MEIDPHHRLPCIRCSVGLGVIGVANGAWGVSGCWCGDWGSFFFFSNGTGEAIIVVKSLGEASFAAKGNLLS